MNDNTLIFSDPGYSVYLLYQKEVYNCDHSFLQAMMDWLYTSNDSPYKFRFRNKAYININHFGISIQKDNTLASSQSQSNESNQSFSQTDSFNWSIINFNLKHLKEIYVDKRHKDTCVLVSKVSSSLASNGQNGANNNPNYVWKQANPSNYQSFRSPYSLNTAYKKSYLLTIVKFKDGPGRLLQSIQLLDSILADYNKKDFNNVKNPNQISKPIDKNVENTNEKASNLMPNAQQYLNEFYSKKNLQQQYQQFQQAQHLNGSSNYLNLNYPNPNLIYNNSQNLAGHSSLKNKYNNSMTNRAQQRRLSVDNKPNIYNSLNPAYNSSNVSLENYFNNTRNAITPTSNMMNNQIGGLGALRSGTISRQSSSNDIRPPVPPQLMNRGFMGGNVHANLNNPSLNHFYPDLTNNSLNTGSVPASPAPNHYLINNIRQYPKMQAPMNSRSSSKSSQIIPNYLNNAKSEINTSNENLSEIGYQQYKKKLSRTRNVPVSSTSSLQNTDLYPGAAFMHGRPNYSSLKKPNKSQNMYFPDLNKQRIEKANQNIYNPNFGFIPISNQNSSTNSVYSSNQRINQTNYSSQSQFYPQVNQITTQKVKSQDNNQSKHAKNEENTPLPSYKNLKSEDDYDSNSPDQDDSSSSPEYTDEDQKNINSFSANNSKSVSNKIDKSKESESLKRIGAAKYKKNNENSTEENESDDEDEDEEEDSYTDIEEYEIDECIENKPVSVEKRARSLKISRDSKASVQQIRIEGTKIKTYPSISPSFPKSPHSIRKSILDLDVQQQQETNTKIAQKILLDYLKNKMETQQPKVKDLDNVDNSKSSPTPLDILKNKSPKKSKIITANLSVLPNKPNLTEKGNRKSQDQQQLGLANYFQATNISDDNKNQPSRYSSNQNLANNETLASSISEQTSSQIQDEIKFEHNKVKEIIKSFNNYEKNFLAKNQNVNVHHLNQVINSTVISNLSNNFEKLFKEQTQHPLIANKDKTASSTSLSKQDPLVPIVPEGTVAASTKFVLNNPNKIKNSSFIQNVKENNHNHYFSNTNSEQKLAKSINLKRNDSQSNQNPIQIQLHQQQAAAPQSNKVNTLVYTFDSKMNQYKQQSQVPINESSLSEYTSLKLQLNESFSSSTNNFSNYEIKQYGYKSNNKNKNSSNDRKPISVISPSSTSSSSNNSSPKQSMSNMNNHYGSNVSINVKNSEAKNKNANSLSPNSNSTNKTQSNVQILKSNFNTANDNSKANIVINNLNSNTKSKSTTNQLAVKFNNLINAELEKSALNQILPNQQKSKNVAKNNKSNEATTATISPKSKSSSVQNLTVDKTSSKPQNLKDFDVPVVKIEKLGAGSAEPQKHFFPEKIEQKIPIVQAQTLPKTQPLPQPLPQTAALPPSTPVQLPQPQPQPQPQSQQTVQVQQRKRTFANMIWPMDPEEEKILRSSSPYVVPEIIVQRNEGVKSILKKHNCLSPSANSTNTSNIYSPPSSNISNTTSTNNSPFGKKRVDFHENFLFFNFFETNNNDEEHNQTNTASNLNLNTTTTNINNNITTTVSS